MFKSVCLVPGRVTLPARLGPLMPLVMPLLLSPLGGCSCVGGRLGLSTTAAWRAGPPDCFSNASNSSFLASRLTYTHRHTQYRNTERVDAFCVLVSNGWWVLSVLLLSE